MAEDECRRERRAVALAGTAEMFELDVLARYKRALLAALITSLHAFCATGVSESAVGRDG